MNFELNKKFLERLITFGKITERDFDVELGKQCGYKKCCIEHYIKLRSYGLPAGLVNDIVLGYEPINYVRCPQCHSINNKNCELNHISSVKAIISKLIEMKLLTQTQFLKYFETIHEYDNV